MGGWSKILKGASKIFKTTGGKAFLGGLGTFFGFEWLTSGGLVDSASDTLGVSENVTSIFLVLIVAGVIYIGFKYVNSKVGAKR